MTKTYSSGKHRVVNADPTPWVGADGSRRARYSRFAPRFDPRPEFDRPLTNEANPILGAFRKHREAVREAGFEPTRVLLSELDQMVPGRDNIDTSAEDDRVTSDQINHARRILTRLANLTKEN